MNLSNYTTAEDTSFQINLSDNTTDVDNASGLNWYVQDENASQVNCNMDGYLSLDGDKDYVEMLAYRFNIAYQTIPIYHLCNGHINLIETRCGDGLNNFDKTIFYLLLEFPHYIGFPSTARFLTMSGTTSSEYETVSY